MIEVSGSRETYEVELGSAEGRHTIPGGSTGSAGTRAVASGTYEREQYYSGSVNVADDSPTLMAPSQLELMPML